MPGQGLNIRKGSVGTLFINMRPSVSGGLHIPSSPPARKRPAKPWMGQSTKPWSVQARNGATAARSTSQSCRHHAKATGD